jgi:hypothetical protein
VRTASCSMIRCRTIMYRSPGFHTMRCRKSIGQQRGSRQITKVHLRLIQTERLRNKQTWARSVHHEAQITLVDLSMSHGTGTRIISCLTLQFRAHPDHNNRQAVLQSIINRSLHPLIFAQLPPQQSQRRRPWSRSRVAQNVGRRCTNRSTQRRTIF